MQSTARTSSASTPARGTCVCRIVVAAVRLWSHQRWCVRLLFMVVLSCCGRVSRRALVTLLRVSPSPNVVVFPTSTEQVSEVVKVCHKHKIPVRHASGPVVCRVACCVTHAGLCPLCTHNVSVVVHIAGQIVPYGSGTSLEGNATTPYKGVCVSLNRMDRVLQVRETDMDATVQPGVRWDDLNTHLKPWGLFFPMDPGPGASIGGMVCGVRAGELSHLCSRGGGVVLAGGGSTLLRGAPC